MTVPMGSVQTSPTVPMGSVQTSPTVVNYSSGPWHTSISLTPGDIAKIAGAAGTSLGIIHSTLPALSPFPLGCVVTGLGVGIAYGRNEQRMYTQLAAREMDRIDARFREMIPDSESSVDLAEKVKKHIEAKHAILTRSSPVPKTKIDPQLRFADKCEDIVALREKDVQIQTGLRQLTTLQQEQVNSLESIAKKIQDIDPKVNNDPFFGIFKFW